MRSYLCVVILLFGVICPIFAATIPGDINNDGQVGLPEAIYALQCVAGIKTNLPTQAEIDELENAVNYAAMAASDSVDTVYSTEELDDILAYMGLSDVQGESALDIAKALITGGFNCGSMERVLSTVTYTFNGNVDCGGVTGTIAVTPQYSEGKISFNIVYTNVVQGDCTINGSGTTTFTAAGSQLIIRHQSDNLTICGQQMNGTTTATVNAITGALISAEVQGAYAYDDGQVQTATVVDMVYADGKLNGTATITSGGQTYNCTFTDVVIDPVCGIPTAGTITIDEYTFDFSETTCENPTVTTTVHGIPVTLSLEEAMAIYESL